MRRALVIVFLLGVVAAAAVWAWQWTRPKQTSRELALHGNVDLRQVEVAFNNSERIDDVLAEEGNHVKRGDVLAKLDTSRIVPLVEQAESQAAAQRHVVEMLHNGSRPQEIAQAEAQLLAQQHVVEKLHNGSRPEEIAQAESSVESAKAEAAYARQRYERLRVLALEHAASQEDLDNAKAMLDIALAKLEMSKKALELIVAGPRKEEIAEAEAKLAALQQAFELVKAGPRREQVAEAEAKLKGAEAQLALYQRQLADAQLTAPTDAIVRSRIMEPGEMASPQKPVMSLAVIDPKWVRAYVSEMDLGKVQHGMQAWIAVDSFPKRRFEGWIGFISPVAEFTPKPVQTEELRTSLVYEVRVFVKDPSDELRLGMPATVYLPLSQNSNSMQNSSVDETQQ